MPSPFPLLLPARLLHGLLPRPRPFAALQDPAGPGQRWSRRWGVLRYGLLSLLIGGLWISGLLLGPAAAWASPGICVGPVCGDGFSRSAKHSFQLRMRLSDQAGRHERITVDCRDGRISPSVGPVERGYGTAVARRVCRLVG